MVLIAGVKYACERCIRGHRVTTCNHTDQPLMMIKPKGRPSSQCKHCKEMRKNKNSHSSGSCTCSKVKKGSSSAAASSSNVSSPSVSKSCGCEASKPCSCHGKRVSKAETNSKKTNSRSSSVISVNIPKAENHSVPSSNNTKANTGSPAPLNTQGSDNSSTQAAQFRQIGLDPLIKSRPIGQYTRTRVGEVSVPLNEYIPNNPSSMGNVSDRIPDGFFQDVPLPFEPGHGLLDLFNDNINNFSRLLSSAVSSSYFTDTQIPTASSKPLTPPLDSNRMTSPIIGAEFFPYYPMQHSQSTNTDNRERNIQRSSSILSNGSSSLSDSRNSLQYSASSDSLASNMNPSLNRSNSANDTSNNYHHYNNMLHQKPPNLTKSLFSGLDDRKDINNSNNDASSIHSVEVLSLTPSFMDLSQPDPSQKAQIHQPNTAVLDENSLENVLYSNNNFINSSGSFFNNNTNNHYQMKPPLHHQSSRQPTNEISTDFINQSNSNLDLDFNASNLLGTSTATSTDQPSAAAASLLAQENEEQEEQQEEIPGITKSLFGNLSIPM